MLKNILKLEGATEVSKFEQKKVNGGIPVGCYFYYYTGLTKDECLAEGGYYTSTGKCRVLMCDNNF